jgi:ferrous iron transport protein B
MSIKIAVAGNPNSGKTTLFNALTGSNQYVGNWPGVTVEKKEGRLVKNPDVILVDLPGIYSLSTNSIEETIAKNFLLEANPDAIINIVDGTSLERNLYLTTQLAELGIPMVLAINMMDVVEKCGGKIDSTAIGSAFGMPVVEISALKETQIDQLIKVAMEAANKKGYTAPHHRFSGGVEHTLGHIEELILHDQPEQKQRWYAVKLFERNELIQEELGLTPEILAHIEKDIQLSEKEFDDDSDSIIAAERYDFIAEVLEKACKHRTTGEISPSDRIDQVVTNRWLALPIFALVMFAVYYISISSVGGLMTSWTNDVLFGELILPTTSRWLEVWGVADWLQGLLVDGILGGVGAVLGFLPQMAVLFLFLSLLEFSGYMARVAFIMDKLFRRFGLSGKSFIPMLIGSGCSVPAILAARTIEDEQDRRMTVITTSFIPCSAKLPVIAMIAGAFFGGKGWISFGAYFLGVAAVIISGLLLKKTRYFSKGTTPFVMELPAYRWPSLKCVLTTTWDRVSSYVKKATTIILLASILIWFSTYFGWVDGQFQMLDRLQLDQSILARLGNSIAWIFQPLGWGDWKAVVAAMTGLVARETIVSTFGIFYGFAEVAETGQEIWTNLRAAFTPLSSASFLIFILLSPPCFAAISSIRREMNSSKWTLFAVSYMTALGYVSALIVYQLGSWISGADFNLWTGIALSFVAVLIWLLFRPAPRKRASLQNSKAEA